MIIKYKDSNKNELLEYIGKDYGKCLYVYIDLVKYNLDDNDDFDAWAQKNDRGEIVAVITEYYKGIQVYSKHQEFEPKEIAEFILEKDSRNIFAIKETIDMLKPYMPGFDEEIGTVGQIKELKVEPNKDAYSAGVDELSEIAKVVAEDENIGKPYGYDSLYKQYKERKEEHMGRNFVLRDKDTNEIVCHAGTYAELPELAVVGGVISSPAMRGKGCATGVTAALSKELLEEGKDVFSFYYIPPATKMHVKCGFEKIGDWAKLMK